jgi:hypothetical protein
MSQCIPSTTIKINKFILTNEMNNDISFSEFPLTVRYLLELQYLIISLQISFVCSKASYNTHSKYLLIVMVELFVSGKFRKLDHGNGFT